LDYRSKATKSTTSAMPMISLLRDGEGDDEGDDEGIEFEVAVAIGVFVEVALRAKDVNSNVVAALSVRQHVLDP
jgi:hypothetical protein